MGDMIIGFSDGRLVAMEWQSLVMFTPDLIEDHLNPATTTYLDRSMA